MSTLLDAPEAPRSVDDEGGTSPATHASRWLRHPLVVYAASRLVCLAVALVGLATDNWSLGRELRNWDGKWYVKLAAHGYAHTIPHHVYSTLGFFPLFSLLMWPVDHVLHTGYIGAGILLSLLFGAVATVLIHRLARDWWGEAAARRAILFFCFFPGTIVFSMVYTEGLLLTLVAGSLLALARRRWLAAGILAGLATAVEPVGLVMIPVTAAVAIDELRRRGPRDPEARRALLAPLLSPAGAVAFGAFLWSWVGTPFATFIAQRDAWHEHSGPLALYWFAHALLEQFLHPSANPIDLNDINGLLGALVLLCGLVLLWRQRARIPLPAAVWTLGVALLAATSDQTPPNARMLVCAFPALLVLAVRLTGRAYRWLLGTSTVLLLVMSFLTLTFPSSLRP